MAKWDRRYHFIGIGGAGMSGLAQILLEKQITVSGSDIKESKTTSKLITMGATVFIGHKGENVTDGTIVVSTAIGPDNPELIRAKELGLPILHRSEILAQLMEEQQGIAIAGAHGKTTTTGMVSMVLLENNLDPTIVVGGRLPQIDANAKAGQGRFLVAEADESDGSFLKLKPQIAVVTNIEDDHLDHYGSVERIVAAFEQFIAQVPDDGLIILWAGDPVLRQISKKVNQQVLFYGEDVTADYYFDQVRTEGLNTYAQVYHRGEPLGTLKLSVPGRHNLLNAMVAVIVGRYAGLSFAQIAAGLEQFKGVNRRFQILGDFKEALVVDDYAHHPTEIKATLAAAKQGGFERIVVAFQPHRYSRTQLLYQEFAGAFNDADLILLTPIYSAGETPLTGVTTDLIINSMAPQVREKTVYLSSLGETTAYLSRTLTKGDLLLTMGAGDIWSVGTQLVSK